MATLLLRDEIVSNVRLEFTIAASTDIVTEGIPADNCQIFLRIDVPSAALPNVTIDGQDLRTLSAGIYYFGIRSENGVVSSVAYLIIPRGGIEELAPTVVHVVGNVTADVTNVDEGPDGISFFVVIRSFLGFRCGERRPGPNEPQGFFLYKRIIITRETVGGRRFVTTTDLIDRLFVNSLPNACGEPIPQTTIDNYGLSITYVPGDRVTVQVIAEIVDYFLFLNKTIVVRSGSPSTLA